MFFFSYICFFFQIHPNFFRDFEFFQKSPRNDVGGASGAPAGPPRNMSGAPDCTDRAVTGVLSMSQISKIYENMSIFQDEDDGGIIFYIRYDYFLMLIVLSLF